MHSVTQLDHHACSCTSCPVSRLGQLSENWTIHQNSGVNSLPRSDTPGRSVSLHSLLHLYRSMHSMAVFTLKSALYIMTFFWSSRLLLSLYVTRSAILSTFSSTLITSQRTLQPQRSHLHPNNDVQKLQSPLPSLRSSSKPHCHCRN